MGVNEMLKRFKLRKHGKKWIMTYYLNIAEKEDPSMYTV